MLLTLFSSVVLSAEEEKKLPLECRIRAVHKGGNDVVQLKITLENVGEIPRRVIMPDPWFNMSAGTEIGGWSFHFIGPDGKAAKLKWPGPPPSPKPMIPRRERLVLLYQGQSIGMTLRLQGQLANPEKVSSLSVTYHMNHKFMQMKPLEKVDWYQEFNPRLWEGEVQSASFDIARFLANRTIYR